MLRWSLPPFAWMTVVFFLPLAVLEAAPPVDDDISMVLRPQAHFEQGESLSVEPSELGLILGDNGAGLYDNRGIFTSPIFDVELPFNAVLFSYRADTPPGTSVEFFLRGWMEGKPTRWYRVDTETEALLPRAVQRLQYRLVLVSDNPTATPSVEELFLLFEHSTHDSPPVTALPRAGSSTATTIPPAPAIVTRQEWGARPPTEEYTTHDVTYLVVHHTAVPTAASYQGASTIRGIQNWHIDGRHWIDIGYHFVIGPDGTIFEGRPAGVRGAHCIPNSGKVGVSVVGDYMEETFTSESRTALIELLAHLAGTYGLSAQKAQAHRDFSTTLCPGDKLYAEMESIREAMAALLSPSSGPSGPPNGGPLFQSPAR